MNKEENIQSIKSTFGFTKLALIAFNVAKNHNMKVFNLEKFIL